MSHTCEKCGHHNGALSRHPIATSRNEEAPSAHLRKKLDEINLMIEAAILRHKTALAVLKTQQRELETELSLVIYPPLKGYFPIDMCTLELYIYRLEPKNTSVNVCNSVLPSVSDLQHYPFLNTIALEVLSVQTLINILNNLPRLLHLTAHLDEDDSMDGSQPVTTAPYLQSLTLVCDSQTPVTSTLDSLKLPGLCRLELEPHLICSELASFLACSSCVLQHLAIDYAESEREEFIDCLRAVPSLTSLAIDVETLLPAVVEQMTKYPSLLPRLRTFTLRGLRHYPEETADHNYLPLLDLLRVRRNPSDPDATKLLLFQLYVDEDPFEYDWLRDDIILAKLASSLRRG
ncbi:hypothetical protein C8R44DRAFT_742058 [Mycena epipterygia]|nr:hypothetical protein C8R44DRAFT_742058 [Mycena epipterygia]